MDDPLDPKFKGTLPLKISYLVYFYLQHHANQIAFKWRTQTRGKNRDKRSAVV